LNRFIKTLALLVVCLFVLVSGVDAALDHISRSVAQSSFTVYNEQGQTVLAYNGDLNACKLLAKPGPALVPRFLHRT
jgi:hypothetical protein